jgi:hypothetical protein
MKWDPGVTYLGNTGDHADDHTGCVVRGLRFEECIWADDVSKSDTNEDECRGDLDGQLSWSPYFVSSALLTIFLVFPPTLPVTRERDSEKVAFEAPVKSSWMSSGHGSDDEDLQYPTSLVPWLVPYAIMANPVSSATIAQVGSYVHTGNGKQQDAGHKVCSNVEMMSLMIDIDRDHARLSGGDREDDVCSLHENGLTETVRNLKQGGV